MNMLKFFYAYALVILIIINQYKINIKSFSAKYFGVFGIINIILYLLK